MTELVVAAQLEQAIDCVDAETGASLRAAFDSMFAQADDWVRRAASINVTSEDQVREMRFARESRLALREIRINAEKTRKKLKADSLLRSRAIDGIYNVIAALIEPVEAHLLEQEEFAERQAEKRRDALREARKQTLVAFGANPATYADLGLMADDAWSQVLASARGARDAREARAREEREAAEAAAAKAKAEAEERAVAEAERARVAAEDRARLERETAEAKRIAAEERAAREKAENEARAERARQESERRQAEEAQAAERDRLQREVDEANARVEAERVARERAEAQARTSAVSPTEPAPATQPSSPSEMWAYAADPDDEEWHGTFATRDEAIEAAFANHDDWKTCAIGRAEWNDPHAGLSADDVCENLLQYHCDNSYESAPDFINARITDEAEHELDVVLRVWAEKHLTHAFWSVEGDREEVQRPGTVAAE